MRPSVCLHQIMRPITVGAIDFNPCGERIRRTCKKGVQICPEKYLRRIGEKWFKQIIKKGRFQERSGHINCATSIGLEGGN